MMRRIAGPIVAIALGLSSAASAQDGDWSGFYVGGEIGAGRSRLNASGADAHTQLSNILVPGRGIVVVPGTTIAFDESGRTTSFVYGGFAGAQLQTGSLVLGIEGDLHGPRDLADASATSPVPATILAPASSATISRSARTSFDWSARARIGTFWGRSMLYATGGIAGARVRLRGEDSFTTPAGAAATGGGIPAFNSPLIGPVVITARERSNMTGWTAGIGGERRVGRRLGLGLEARYTDFGSHDFALAGGCNPATVAAGQCAGATRTSPPIVVNGNTLDPNTQVTPGTTPGTTRISLNEWRIAARLSLRF
ncbi:MAG TPA: outer membrane beta-barrel protein [Allosphingosinicella sp.]|nr:outer membrane beta-barrel protein [Allosphingosinicella sp.]